MGLKFQTITVESAEPLTTCLRLGLKQQAKTLSLWPLKDLLSEGSERVELPPALFTTWFFAPFAPIDYTEL